MSSLIAVIDKLAFGGNGVCRIDGKVCFVPFACPGDEVRLTVVSEKKSYLTACIAELITPSPCRVAPPCPLFGRCGGCNWQHVGYQHQLEAKRQILAEALWRGARVENDRVMETLPALQEYGYRNRVQLKLHAGPDKLHIGFYRTGSHYVEDAPQGCPIALPVINQALVSLRHVLADFPEPASIPQINIECGEQGAVATVNYIGQSPKVASRYFRERFHLLAPLTGLYLQTGRKSTLQKISGDGELAYTLPGCAPGDPGTRLTFRPGSFSQVNGMQNRAILGLVRRFAALQGGERLLDLYCGNGNFSLPLAGNAATVTGLEGYEDSIAAAQENCRLNNITNADYVCSDARQGVEQLAVEGREFDVVILDPPRSGAAELIPALCRLNADKIIYISCDPSTFARDCGILAGRGYHVIESIPVDMFPQTYHLESVSLLQKG